MKALKEKKEYLVFGILIVAFAIVSIFSISSIRLLQGNARVINFAGIVRGATQKLIKEEIMGWYFSQEDSSFSQTSDWYPDDKLVKRLDTIVNELLTGEGSNDLIVLQDKEYLENMRKVQEHWTELKRLIIQVREGTAPLELFESSQNYFNLVNDTVFSAEAYAEKQVNRINFILMFVYGVFLFLIISTLIYYVRRIANPVKKLTFELSNLANGIIGNPIQIKSKDEIGILAESVNAVSNSIRQLNREISLKISNYDKGLSSSGMSTENFEGCYKEIAENIDNMTSHMDKDFESMLVYISKFSDGNFEADLPDMPGERAIANQMINNIKENLINVQNGILSLVDSTVKGKLDARINPKEYKGGWKEIVLGLNNLLDAVSEPYAEITTTLKEMVNGNMKHRITKNFEGEYGVIKDLINETTSTLSSYIDEITSILNEMADENFKLRIDREYAGDFENIKKSINIIINIINGVLLEIKKSAGQISSGSSQISESSMNLAAGASSQANAVNMLEHSMEELTNMIRETSENSQRVDSLTKHASVDIAGGKNKMLDLVEAINNVAEASRSINNIVKVMEDISFQTNLLALNAAVEAARAGQHGKGFGVVAEEVRNLALRSATSSKEITKIIENVLNCIDIGVNLASETSSGFEKISEQINSISEIIKHISENSAKQESTILKNNENIIHISEVASTNSATSENTAVAVEKLAEQSELFFETVTRFKLSDS